MRPADFLILLLFFLLCTLGYTAVLLLRQNRTTNGLRRVGFGAAVVLLLCAALWYTVFAGPYARNWGLGGSYAWLAVCPGLYLLCGVIVSLANAIRR